MWLKKVLTPRRERFLGNVILENRKIARKDLKLFEESGLTVSDGTTSRNLYELGFKSQKPVKRNKIARESDKSGV